MLEERANRQAFFSAPQSVLSLVAALLEPGITALVLVAAHAMFAVPFQRPSFVVCLLVFALTFPGRNRFGDALSAAGVDIATSWLAQIGLLALGGYATRSFADFDSRVLLTWVVSTPFVQLIAVAAGRRWVARRQSHRDSRRSAIVIGAGPLGAKIARALSWDGEQRADLLGYFDDRSNERLHPDAVPLMRGRLCDVAAFVRRRHVREVYITLPNGSQPRIVKLLEGLQDTTASLFFVPDVFAISIIQGRLHDVNGVPVVGVCETPFTGTNALIKRTSDVVIATAALVFAAPLLVALAIGVKASSPGPVIFRQRRNGLDGDEIAIWKFRSMTVQEEGPDVPQASRNDPRVTRFGAFLRRTSLDELPQFFNVLQGRMSIVGPRPHAVAHNDAYRQIVKAYMVRHKVRPGITGWAQVNGLRGETDTIDKMKARVEYDLEYLRRWSLQLDLQIIVRTVRLVLADRNAY